MTATLENVKKRLANKSASIQMFMQSPLGKEIIQALEDEFYDGELMDDDPHKTYYNLGRRDVVVYLKQLQNWRKNDDRTT